MKMQTASGAVREKFRNTGLEATFLSLQLGVDFLPSTLRDGIMLTVAGDELAVWVRDESLGQDDLGDWQYPKHGVLEFSKKLVRDKTSRVQEARPEDDNEVQLIIANARRALQDRSMAVLPHSPFPVTGPRVTLNDLLDKVG